MSVYSYHLQSNEYRCTPLLRLIAAIYTRILLSDLVYIYLCSNTPYRCMAVVTYFS